MVRTRTWNRPTTVSLCTRCLRSTLERFQGHQAFPNTRCAHACRPGWCCGDGTHGTFSLMPVVLKLLQKLPNSTYHGSSYSSHTTQAKPGNTQVWGDYKRVGTQAERIFADRQSTSVAKFRPPDARNNPTFVQDKEDGLKFPADIQVKQKPQGRGNKEQVVQSCATREKPTHSSDWVLLTIPGLCCSSSMLLRIMQALVTLPSRETGRNLLWVAG